MANIPSAAISASLDAIQRPTNQSIHARQVQAQKNVHHQEEVEELDDAAVGSIRDQEQHHQHEGKSGGGGEGERGRGGESESESKSRLDISA